MNRSLRNLFLAFTLIFLMSPIVVVGGVSLNAKKSLFFPPQGFSLAWYVELFTESAWLIPVKNSLVIATLASAVALSIALPLAYFLWRCDSAFYTWLYRIGINTAKNHLVAMGPRAQTSTEMDAEEAASLESGDQLRDLNTPEKQMLSRQVGETVNQTLQELPEELRTAITLREIEGLSYEEIATVMQCPVGTVRSRIFRAREAVAEKLRPLLGTSKDRRW